MALTNDQLVTVSQLIVKCIELQQQVADPTLKEILAHVISKLHGLVWG